MIKHYHYKGKSISYQISGKGEALLLLHGFCEDSRIWDSYSEYFSKKYTVIRPDLPGFGKSDFVGAISIEEMAQIVFEILKAENFEHCLFVGHSMGGYVAMAFAEQYPEALKALCLFHSHPFEDLEEKKINRKKTIDFMKKWGVAPFVKELVAHLFARDFRSKNHEIVQELIGRASSYSKDALISATEAMIQRKDRSEILKNLKIPVLFIVGEFDEAIPKDFSMKQLELKSDATYSILPIGHMGMFEAEKETISVLDAFVSKVVE
jgi:pimeloyl-ACP methyl ester carboxylesterase